MAQRPEQSVFWRVGQMKQALFLAGCPVQAELKLELELEFEAQDEFGKMRLFLEPDLVE